MSDTNVKHPEYTYDLVCSLGERCMTAHQMRINQLRSESNPFDWLISENIHAVIDTILDNWNHFFLRENLSVIYKGPVHTQVIDNATGFISLHDFDSNISFDENYERFITKYTRRIHRFMNLIQTKKNILFVRTNVSNDQIDDLLRLTTVNPNAHIDFLIVNTVSTPNVSRLESPYDNVHIYQISDQPDLSYDVWMGNHAHWKEVLSHYTLRGYHDFLVEILKKYTQNKSLVIWGFGGAGRKIIAHLTTNKDTVPIAWVVDSNPEKYGKINDTLEVKPVESLVSHTEDVLVLISIYDDTTEIEKTLKEMHFSPESYKKVIYDGLTPIGIG